MLRKVPMWVVALVFMIMAGMTMFVSWSARTVASGGQAPLGVASYLVSKFPDLVSEAVDETIGRMTGEYEESVFLARNDDPRELVGFTPIENGTDVAIDGLTIKKGAGTPTPGWRFLTGGFVLDGKIENSVLMLSPDLKVARVWRLSHPASNNNVERPEAREAIHGLEVFKDGSIVFTFDGSALIKRWDACSNVIWDTPEAGHYHHSVAQSDDGKSVWTFNEFTSIAHIDVATGKFLQRITIDDIIEANPNLHLLELRRVAANRHGYNPKNVKDGWLDDAWHLNDVEPLPAKMADAFPQFEAGDLLLSSRSLNLIFVLDPETAKIKWWHMGRPLRQHDPDWQADGTITVYNNRMGYDYSEILKIDPQTHDEKVVFSGEDNGFFSRIRGKHQFLDDGHMIVASTQQGWAFETDADGKFVLEIENRKPGTVDNFAVTEMKWFPIDYFDEGAFKCVN